MSAPVFSESILEHESWRAVWNLFKETRMARKYSKAASEKVERTMHAHKQATLESAFGKGEKQEAGDCNRTFRSTQGGQKGAGKKEGGDVQMTTRTPKPVSPQRSLQCLSTAKDSARKMRDRETSDHAVFATFSVGQ